MFLRKFLPAACSLLLAGCVGARLFLRSDKYLREKVVAVLPLRDTDAGEAEVAKHILAMLGAFAPTLHRGAPGYHNQHSGPRSLPHLDKGSFFGCLGGADRNRDGLRCR